MDTTTAQPNTTQAELAELHHQLARLTDHHDISHVIHQLGQCLDEARFDEMADLFADDATARTPGGQAQDRDALIAQASRSHPPEDRIQHLFGDMLIDIADDQATVRANALITFARGDQATTPDLTIGELYRFTLARSSSGWRITSVDGDQVWLNGPGRPGT